MVEGEEKKVLKETDLVETQTVLLADVIPNPNKIFAIDRVPVQG